MSALPGAEPRRVRVNIPPPEVDRQLERICKSKAFRGLDNAERILRYLVAETLEGRVPRPKDIALHGLGKENFDRGDSQVRKDTGKLRGKLNEYYLTEAKDDEIWFEVPERQYTVFWRHSPKTLLGQSETTGWVISASQLPEELAQRAAETANRFWPHLASVFSVYCYEGFDTHLDNGTFALPDIVRMFFASIENNRFYLTSPDHAEIRIYPLNVWLAEWARLKSSENVSDRTMLRELEFWGAGGEIENRSSITIHEKLIKQLNVPVDRQRSITLSFHPNGYLRFEVDKPVPRPPVKCSLYLLRYHPGEEQACYAYLLVDTNIEQAFLDAMASDVEINLDIFGYMIETGPGEPPEGLEERLLAKYDFVLTKAVTES